MIGVIQRNKLFEFRDDSELCKALDWFGSKYGCDTIYVVDTSDRIKMIIYRESFLVNSSLYDETKYYIYGDIGNTGKDLQLNDLLPNKNNCPLGQIPFAYISQRVPKEIDIY